MFRSRLTLQLGIARADGSAAPCPAERPRSAPETAVSRDDGMLRALRIVNDAESEELVLMHGKRGVYRTGPMAAKYRAGDMAEATAHVRRADGVGIRTALEHREPCTSRLPAAVRPTG